ncbi:MAG: PaaI family thioesterase [Mangrovicoccus sp.]|nr:PaaI family thioesterase [Mangrovicoccus sp.]
MDQKIELVRSFITQLPYSAALSLKLEEIGPGWAVMRLPWSDELVGDTETGVIHGGAVSSLIDTVCGAAVMTHPKAGESSATLDLRIDYMRPATPGRDLYARAECHQMTRTVAFLRAQAHDGDANRLVAQASAAFTVQGASK